MSKVKTTEWLGSLISAILFALLALASWVLSEFLQRGFGVGIISSSGPNTIIENAEITRTNSLGSPVLRLSAAAIAHTDHDDKSELTQVRIISLNPDQPVTNVRAAKAVTSDRQNKVDLSGDVIIQRYATTSQPAITVRTPRATILVEEERMQTDAPVLVQHGQSTLQGIGMRLDQKTQKFEILSESRMVILKENPQP
jgi:lipopolysaccharide export system protein LptC